MLILKGPPICNLNGQAAIYIYNLIFTILGLLIHHPTTGKDGRISHGNFLPYHLDPAVCTYELWQGTMLFRTTSYTINSDYSCPNIKGRRNETGTG